MILEHVPHNARLVVEIDPALDADLLQRRDLHALHVVPVPDRLEDRVQKAEIKQVLDRLFAHVMIDPVHLALVKNALHCAVQRGRRDAVVAERLLDHNPAPVATVFVRHSGRAKLGDAAVIQARGDRQVVDAAG